MFNTISLSGGAVGGVAQLACVRELIRNIKTQKLVLETKRFAGTSIGSFVALALACGCTSDDLLSFESTMNVSDFYTTTSWYTPWMHWIRLVSSFGMYHTATMRDRILSLTAPYGITATTTFRDLYTRTQNELIVTAMNISKQRPVIFSVRATPDASVIDACCASACLPGVFVPVKATAETVDQRTDTVLISVGDLLLDGVLICVNPDEQIRDHYVGTSSPMILSIDIWTAANRSRASAQSLPAPTTIVDFLSLMTRAWSGATQFLGDQLLTIQNTHTTITIGIFDAYNTKSHH